MFTKADAPSLQSNNNTRGLKANINSRRQVKVPKSLLGYCAPLALQTNGEYEMILPGLFYLKDTAYTYEYVCTHTLCAMHYIS